MDILTVVNFFYKLRRKVFLLWYKIFFKKIGYHSAIQPPLFFHNPQFVEIGDNVYIGPFCRIEVPLRENDKVNPKLVIGSGTDIQHSVNIYCSKSLIIGENVLIASGCLITDNNHGINPEGDKYLSQSLTVRPTIIEQGVWLGERVCVLAGAQIGERSIIGANSVVTGKIPPYSIAVGNPAKVIKTYDFETKCWVARDT